MVKLGCDGRYQLYCDIAIYTKRVRCRSLEKGRGKSLINCRAGGQVCIYGSRGGSSCAHSVAPHHMVRWIPWTNRNNHTHHTPWNYECYYYNYSWNNCSCILWNWHDCPCFDILWIITSLAKVLHSAAGMSRKCALVSCHCSCPVRGQCQPIPLLLCSSEHRLTAVSLAAAWTALVRLFVSASYIHLLTVQLFHFELESGGSHDRQSWMMSSRERWGWFHRITNSTFHLAASWHFYECLSMYTYIVVSMSACLCIRRLCKCLYLSGYKQAYVESAAWEILLGILRLEIN